MVDPTRILGIDLGISSTGWACLETMPESTIAGPIAGPVVRCLAAGEIDLKTRGYEGSGMRPFRFRRAVRGVIREHHPTVVVYELVRNHRQISKEGRESQGVEAAHVYGMLQAALLETCESLIPPFHTDGRPGVIEGCEDWPRVPCTALVPAEWKRHLLGKGNATKTEVAQIIERMPGWPWARGVAGVLYPYDVTDAAGIALGWARKQQAER
jgi:Holliday junction resolvasome RuvABC endonuclease subunit